MVLASQMPFWAPSGFAEEYQKAKDPLLAQVVRSSPLKSSPDFKSKSLFLLRARTQVLIIGRKGVWFDVTLKFKKKVVRGWIHRNYLKVMGPVATSDTPPSNEVSKGEESQMNESTQTVRAPTRRRTRSVRPSKRRSFTTPAHPNRMAVRAGFAFGAKDANDQFRGGLDYLRTVWPATEIGLTAEAAFKDGKIYSFGPAIVHNLDWPRLGSIWVAGYAAFPFYYVKAGGTTDNRFGFRFGPEFSYPITTTQSGNKIRAVLRVTADVILFGTDRVSIPVAATAGVGFRF